VLFGYHVGARSLVCPLPEPGGAGAPTHFAIATEALRAQGWKASDRDLEKTLPRADTPPVFRPSAAEISAVAKRR
jgi:hypothetical protein